MQEANDAAYYAARAARAQELAEAAQDPGIAAIHRRMAASYAELAELMAPKRPDLRAVRS